MGKGGFFFIFFRSAERGDEDGAKHENTPLCFRGRLSKWQRVRTRWVLATRTRTRQIKILLVGLLVPAGG